MKYRVTFILVSLIFGFWSCDNGDEPADTSKSVVINELLPKNVQNGSDEDGDYDDWIELYNTANEAVDISGYYLADSKKNPTKWKFPQGTIIQANGYLIVWADEDSTHVSGLHTNYKLSADGENVVLLTPTQELINLVEYPATLIEQSYARKPNGTGDFVWSAPSYNKTND
ncbi:MAG: lamin tail domain-containing protein [Draconibacterium sp.]